METKLQRYFNGDLKKCEKIMDWATSDKTSIRFNYKINAWNILADICSRHFSNEDWCWSDVIEHWKDEDIIEVIQDYKALEINKNN